MEIERCTTTGFFQFSALPGAVSYSLTIKDSLTTTYTFTGPPFSADGAVDGHPPVGKGLHRVGLTGGTGPNCGSQSDGFYAPSRWKVLSFTATMDGKSRVAGSVLSAAGRPVKGVKIDVRGPGGTTATTNAGGAYGAKVKKGEYTVSAPERFCVVGIKKCTNEKSVKVNGTAVVNFTARSKEVKLSGHVYERTCGGGRCGTDGLAGVTVSATGGGDLASITTDDRGKWELEVEAGTWKVTPKAPEREFTPESSRIKATEDRGNIDFTTCTAAPAADARAAQAPALCGPDALDWTMPERLSIKNASNQDLTLYGLPQDSFVAPEKWKPQVFLTQEGARYKCTTAEAKTWKWEVVKKPDGAKVDLPDSGCKIEMRVTKLGHYKLKATGKVPGVGKVTKPGTVYVKDLLIAGMGDSNGSGEGNTPFYFKRCNRSVAAYQFQVALWVEEHDPRTSVTFLHTSCSGATIEHVYKFKYEGTRKGHGGMLDQQMWQIQHALPSERAKNPSRPRKVDAAMISGGVNNLGFGALMSFCAKHPEGSGPPSCADLKVSMIRNDVGGVARFEETPLSHLTMRKALDRLVGELPGRLRSLMAAVKRPMDGTRMTGLGGVAKNRLLLATYPDFTRDDRTLSGACDTTGFAGAIVEWSEATWKWIGVDGGNALNAAIFANQGLGYTQPFEPQGIFFNKGYCTNAGWVRAIGGALVRGDFGGPFHPLYPSHEYAAAFQRVALCQALYGTNDCHGRLKD